MRNRFSVVGLLLAGVSGVSTAFIASPAMAQTAPATKSYDIPSQPLGGALNSFAEQSGVEILFDPNVVRGKRSRALRGNYTSDQALSMLLRDTGLVMRQGSGSTILIETESSTEAGPPSGEGYADNQSAGAAGQEDAEIVVTARKRDESVQDIPESIRALSNHELQRLGADSMEGYAGVTPSLQLTGTRAATQVAIRGVTTGPVSQDQTEIKETVGIYLDETAIAVQRYNPNVRLFDLERIEVLRGPQGTLYGAGSMAGAIRMITRKPQAQDLEAEFEASAGTISHGGEDYSVDGMINLPLVTDVLAVRAVGSYRRDGGYIDNISLNVPNANSSDSYSGRIAARFTPTTNFTLDAMLYHQDTDYRTLSTYALEEGPLKTNSVVFEPSHDRFTIASLTGNYEADFADFTIIGSYLRKKLDYDLDIGSFPSFLTGTHDDFGALLINYSNQKVYSVEARVSSKPDAGLHWIAGVFFQHLENAFGQDSTVPGLDAITGIDSTLFGANPDQIYFSDIDVREKQLAFFGEANIPIGEKVTLTVGGRQFFAWQDARIDFEGIFAAPNTGISYFKNKESGFNPKVNLTYKFDRDSLVYAQAAKGFRLGGTNEPVPEPACTPDLEARGLDAVPPSYSSDNLWNYEVGAKTSWLDRRLTINAAVYRIDWKSPQVAAHLDCGYNIFVNAGGLRIYGGELEAALRPVRGLTLSAGAGYTDSELTEDLAFVGGEAGDHAPYTAKWTFNASADYTSRISDSLSGFFYVNFQHVGRRTSRFAPADPANIEFPAYGVVNARLGINSDRWSIELFGQNLTDSLGKLNQTPNPYAYIPVNYVTVIKPRTIGIKLRYKI